jgi:ADP-dependent NAD(P)H-hydrate dehydratase
MTTPVEITPVLLQDHPLPDSKAESDKDGHGRVLVIGGAVELAGAAVLAGVAALRAGAGKLRFAAPEAYAVQLGFQVPEARVIRVPTTQAGEVLTAAVGALRSSLESFDAVVIGPGMLDEADAAALTEALLRASTDAAFLIDAAAMTGLRDIAEAAKLCAGRAVLTPHCGEMAKLMDRSEDDVRADAAGVALQAARRFDAVVTLKDRQTHVASPDGRVWRNSNGVAGLGVCGSGDVLSGVIGGLLARGAPPEVAALWGVYLHAQAGRRLSSAIGSRGFLAREISDGIPAELEAVRAA